MSGIMMNNGMPSTRTPVSIITGYLGSGKTTLLNALLTRPALAGSLVIINEFGEIGIDHLLVSTPSDNMYLLSNGCLCCAFTGDLVETLQDADVKRVRGDIPMFDRVIVETTGLADPVPIMQTVVKHEGLSERFALESVVTLVDAVHGDAQLDRHDESIKQVAVADCLLVTKIDLANDADVAALRERLGAANPDAEICATTRGDVDPAVLFDRARRRGVPSAERIRFLPAAGASTPRHGEGLNVFCSYYEGRISPAGVGLWLDMLATFLGPDLLRVKGLLNVEGKPVVVHAVQSVIHEPEYLNTWPDEDRRSRLVFITRGIAKERLERTFEAFSAADAFIVPGAFLDPQAVARFGRLARTFRY